MSIANPLAKWGFNEFVRVRLIGNGHALLVRGCFTNSGGDIRTYSRTGYVWSVDEFGVDHWRSSAVGTWITQRFQDRRDLIGKQIVRREALYSDFIAESARLLVDAMEHSDFDLQKMIPVYALVSRIRLSSSETVLHRAEQIIKVIVDTYPQPNLTPDQIQSQAVNGQDPLREFSDCCRAELDWLQRQV